MLRCRWILSINDSQFNIPLSTFKWALITSSLRENSFGLSAILQQGLYNSIRYLINFLITILITGTPIGSLPALYEFRDLFVGV